MLSHECNRYEMHKQCHSSRVLKDDSPYHNTTTTIIIIIIIIIVFINIHHLIRS